MEGARKVPEEVRQILSEICAEYRVRIDPDDPAVVVVMLNRRVLELMLDRAIERIEVATAELGLQIDAAQVRMGTVLAQELRAARAESSGHPWMNFAPMPAVTPIAFPKLTLIVAMVAVFGGGVVAGVLIR